MLPISSLPRRRALIQLALSLVALFLVGSMALWAQKVMPHALTQPCDEAITHFLHGDHIAVTPSGALISFFFAFHGLVAGVMTAATRR